MSQAIYWWMSPLSADDIKAIRDFRRGKARTWPDMSSLVKKPAAKTPYREVWTKTYNGITETLIFNSY